MASASKTVKKAAMKILQAADAGDLRSLKSKGTRIAQAIASVRHGSRDGRGVLHIAAAKGRTEICQYLIEELGFNSNLVPDNGKTPIFHATYGGHINTVRYLLDHGANPNVRDKDGFTPLHWAVIEGYAEILDLLLSRGGPIEARNIAGTPLILATCKADDSCMKALLDHNADPNQVSDGFFTPLFIAVINDSTKCVEVLLKAGADVNKVPLLELAFDSAKMLDYLLEVGADPNIPNDYGRLPIEIAAVRGKREVVEKLYPLTSPIPIVSDWSIYGLFRHVESPIYQVEEELQSKKRLDRLKRKADSALSRKEYMVSIFLWTYAMSEDPNDVTIHANRCLCWLHLCHGINALIDAYTCYCLRSKCPISYLCLGSAFSCLKGLSLDPANREIQKALQKTMEQKPNESHVTGTSIVQALEFLSITNSDSA